MLTSLLFFSSVVVADSQYRILRHFAGGSLDGATPYGELLPCGSVLYGMTHNGGSSNNGTIYKINTDGSGFGLLHSFNGGTADGYQPHGSLIQIGSTLYGMTYGGGASGYGIVFKINTDGTDFEILHSFTGSDGKYPNRSLVQSGDAFYGMTSNGGSSDLGAIFKIDADGSNFQMLHNFAGSSVDGAFPTDSLINDGSALYGMTRDGGSSNIGCVFKMNFDGSGFQLLHSFNGSDGSGPHGSLAQCGSTLYGMATMGGSSSLGTIFRINTGGSNFDVLHNFSGASADGSWPIAAPALSERLIFGITYDGGSSNRGIIFQINNDGSDFQILHSFSGGVTDGSYPRSLVVSGLTLYGVTSDGGNNNKGVIFAYDLEFADCNEVKEAGFRLDADIYGDGDCYVDLYDFSVLAAQWLNCNNPLDANCM